MKKKILFLFAVLAMSTTSYSADIQCDSADCGSTGPNMCFETNFNVRCSGWYTAE